MFTTYDKAIAALLMGIAFFINNTTGFHFAITEAYANMVGMVLSPIVVALIPNKK